MYSIAIQTQYMYCTFVYCHCNSGVGKQTVLKGCEPDTLTLTSLSGLKLQSNCHTSL
jgi:hypothetical protein